LDHQNSIYKKEKVLKKIRTLHPCLTNMQITPASTHSHQLKDPLFDNHTLTWLVTRVCDVRNTSDFKPRSLVQNCVFGCSFLPKRKYSTGLEIFKDHFYSRFPTVEMTNKCTLWQHSTRYIWLYHIDGLNRSGDNCTCKSLTQKEACTSCIAHTETFSAAEMNGQHCSVIYQYSCLETEMF